VLVRLVRFNVVDGTMAHPVPLYLHVVAPTVIWSFNAGLFGKLIAIV
jgi:hypothetical protein